MRFIGALIIVISSLAAHAQTSSAPSQTPPTASPTPPTVGIIKTYNVSFGTVKNVSHTPAGVTTVVGSGSVSSSDQQIQFSAASLIVRFKGVPICSEAATSSISGLVGYSIQMKLDTRNVIFSQSDSQNPSPTSATLSGERGYAGESMLSCGLRK